MKSAMMHFEQDPSQEARFARVGLKGDGAGFSPEQA